MTGGLTRYFWDIAARSHDIRGGLDNFGVTSLDTAVSRSRLSAFGRHEADPVQEVLETRI
jgi:hypothetical protein